MTAIAFTELNESAINEVLASARTRGIYKEQADTFLSMERPGAEINLKDGPFKGKKANTVKQGFSLVAAKAEYSDRLRVVESDGRVVLINKELA